MQYGNGAVSDAAMWSALEQAGADGFVRAFPGEMSAYILDHMVGNIIVSYSMTADEDFYSQMDAAWNDLVASSGLEQAF